MDNVAERDNSVDPDDDPHTTCHKLKRNKVRMCIGRHMTRHDDSYASLTHITTSNFRFRISKDLCFIAQERIRTDG